VEISDEKKYILGFKEICFVIILGLFQADY